MKTLLVLTLFFVVGCKEQNPIDNKGESLINRTIINQSHVPGADIYQIKLGLDTVIIAVGINSGYPVAITKK